MEVQLKRERCEHKVSTFLPASVKAELDKYAKKEGVKDSAAVRYILALFFANDHNSIEAFGNQNSGNIQK